MNTGEVWLVDFQPSVGAEIQKIRPAVIVNDSSFGLLPLSVVVPLTSWQVQFQQYPWIVHIFASPQNGLKNDSGADVFQVKSLAHQRFQQKIGNVSTTEFHTIKQALALLFDI